MEKKLAATEVRVRFGEILKRVSQGEKIIVERAGTPLAVILSIEEFRRLQTQDKEGSRKEQLHKIEALRKNLKGPVPDAVELIDHSRKERENALLSGLR
ncbi:MAG: addiction module antitoxin [Aquificota bacterium]|nr:MAG: addiction module antitoxin [Aquificota bacterium]